MEGRTPRGSELLSACFESPGGKQSAHVNASRLASLTRRDTEDALSRKRGPLSFHFSNIS